VTMAVLVLVTVDVLESEGGSNSSSDSSLDSSSNSEHSSIFSPQNVIISKKPK
jgi:hypothetical protein